MNAANPADRAGQLPDPESASTTDVSSREVKSSLSSYVARASQGEIIRITDRGIPKATSSPIRTESRIEQGFREGWISGGRALGEVGIRDLKSALATYLQYASQGERVWITHRGVPTAVLGPPTGDDWIKQGIREGWLTAPSVPPDTPWVPPTPVPCRGTKTTTELIREDRDA